MRSVCPRPDRRRRHLPAVVRWRGRTEYAPWAHDKAKRAGETSFPFPNWSPTPGAQEKPKLPAPHQVGAEIWKTTGAMVASAAGRFPNAR